MMDIHVHFRLVSRSSQDQIKQHARRAVLMQKNHSFESLLVMGAITGAVVGIPHGEYEND